MINKVSQTTNHLLFLFLVSTVALCGALPADWQEKLRETHGVIDFQVRFGIGFNQAIDSATNETITCNPKQARNVNRIFRKIAKKGGFPQAANDPTSWTYMTQVEKELDMIQEECDIMPGAGPNKIAKIQKKVTRQIKKGKIDVEEGLELLWDHVGKFVVCDDDDDEEEAATTEDGGTEEEEEDEPIERRRRLGDPCDAPDIFWWYDCPCCTRRRRLDSNSNSNDGDNNNLRGLEEKPYHNFDWMNHLFRVLCSTSDVPCMDCSSLLVWPIYEA